MNLVIMSRPDSRYQIHCTQLVAELRCVLEPLFDELFEQVCAELAQHLQIDVSKSIRAGESYTEAFSRMDALSVANKLWQQGLNNMCSWQDDLHQEVEQLRQKTDFRANIQRTLSSLAEACGRCAKWHSEWTPTEGDFLKRFVCCIADWPFFANIRYMDSNYDTRSQALRDVTERTCYRIMESATQDIPDMQPSDHGAMMVAHMIDNGHLRLSPVAEEPAAQTGSDPAASTTSHRSTASHRSSRKSTASPILSAVSNRSTRSTQSNRSRRSDRSTRSSQRNAPSPQTRTIILSPDKSPTKAQQVLPADTVMDVASAISSVRSTQSQDKVSYQSLAEVSLPVSPHIVPEDSISNIMIPEESV